MNETLREPDDEGGAWRGAVEDLRTSRLEAVECLCTAIELHDRDAGRHIKAVASTAALLAAKLGLDATRVDLLRVAAAMHDLGKIATPDGVLRKREPLTASERERMKAHTTVGHELLRECESDLMKMAATIALTHHERFDGSGYPQGLGGADIPIEGRIVAVADALDALLREHPYRPAFTVGEAKELIAAERGTHFDPQVVDALLDNLDEAIALGG
jgi:putative nucleotidyltransferase with HDIG domain